jgi:hypothetical protein
MRRVRLPRLDFSHQPQHSMNNYLPYAADDDLPSPEELIAKLEFLKLKNEEASQRYNVRRRGYRIYAKIKINFFIFKIGEKCRNPPPPEHSSAQSFGRNWKKEMSETGHKPEQRR